MPRMIAPNVGLLKIVYFPGELAVRFSEALDPAIIIGYRKSKVASASSSLCASRWAGFWPVISAARCVAPKIHSAGQRNLGLDLEDGCPPSRPGLPFVSKAS